MHSRLGIEEEQYEVGMNLLLEGILIKHFKES